MKNKAGRFVGPRQRLLLVRRVDAWVFVRVVKVTADAKWNFAGYWIPKWEFGNQEVVGATILDWHVTAVSPRSQIHIWERALS